MHGAVNRVCDGGGPTASFVHRTILSASSLVALLASPGWARADAPAVTEESLPRWKTEGYFDVRYGLHGDNEALDHDLREFLSVSLFETESRWISAHVAAFASQDLNGFDTPDRFLSIPDTHDRYYTQLDSAYVEFRPDWRFLETARFGRQWITEVPELVRMDGARLETRPLERVLHTRAMLFGGLPWHAYESSRRDDYAVGFGLAFRPWNLARLSVAYTRLQDVYEQQWVDDVSLVSKRHDLLSLELRKSFFKNQMAFFGAYTNLDGESRDTRARLSYDSEDGTWRASVDYRYLFTTQEALSTELDPYFSILRSYHPYQEARIDVDYSFTHQFSAGAGAAIRRLESRRDRGAFNHDFERYYLCGDLEQWPFKGSSLSVYGNLYLADGDQFWELEGSWGHAFSECIRAELGTSYSLYHEDRYTFEERNHVRSLFLLLEIEPREDVVLTGRYAVELDDEGTTNRLELGIRYQF